MNILEDLKKVLRIDILAEQETEAHPSDCEMASELTNDPFTLMMIMTCGIHHPNPTHALMHYFILAYRAGLDAAKSRSEVSELEDLHKL